MITMLFPASFEALIAGPGAVNVGIASKAVSWLLIVAKLLLELPPDVLAVLEFAPLVVLVELAVLELPQAAPTKATAAKGRYSLDLSQLRPPPMACAPCRAESKPVRAGS
ncbi:MAG: hypothetical protein M0Z39_06995 [Actinomycetota bacterium]|nr:hypothetical protein [Actinomycetota bacterium]